MEIYLIYGEKYFILSLFLVKLTLLFIFRKKFLFCSKEQACFTLAMMEGYTSTEAQQYIRQSPNLLEYLHEFYCQLYRNINLDIAQIEENWRTGRHRLQRINCESENNKGKVLDSYLLDFKEYLLI